MAEELDWLERLQRSVTDPHEHRKVLQETIAKLGLTGKKLTREDLFKIDPVFGPNGVRPSDKAGREREVEEYDEAGGGILTSLEKAGRRLYQFPLAAGAYLADKVGAEKTSTSLVEEMMEQNKKISDLPTHPAITRASEMATREFNLAPTDAENPNAGFVGASAGAVGQFGAEAWRSPDTLGALIDQSAELAPQLATMATGVGAARALVGRKITEQALKRYSQRFGPAAAKGMMDRQLAAQMAIGGGLSSVANTFGPNVAEQIEKGLDLDQAIAKGATQSLVQGGIDALTAGIVPWRIGPNQFVNIPAQALIQAAGGAGGEYLANLSTGDINDPGELVAEGLLELIGLPGEIAIAAFERSKQPKGGAVAPNAPVDPSAPPPPVIPAGVPEGAQQVNLGPNLPPPPSPPGGGGGVDETGRTPPPITEVPPSELTPVEPGEVGVAPAPEPFNEPEFAALHALFSGGQVSEEERALLMAKGYLSPLATRDVPLPRARRRYKEMQSQLTAITQPQQLSTEIDDPNAPENAPDDAFIGKEFEGDLGGKPVIMVGERVHRDKNGKVTWVDFTYKSDDKTIKKMGRTIPVEELADLVPFQPKSGGSEVDAPYADIEEPQAEEPQTEEQEEPKAQEGEAQSTGYDPLEHKALRRLLSNKPEMLTKNERDLLVKKGLVPKDSTGYGNPKTKNPDKLKALPVARRRFKELNELEKSIEKAKEEAKEPWDQRPESKQGYFDGWLDDEGRRNELVAHVDRSFIPGGGGAGSLIYDEHKRVIGRVASANPQWVQDILAREKTTVKFVKEAVRKAVNKEKLTPKEARLVGLIIGDLEEEVRAAIRKEFEDITDDPKDVERAEQLMALFEKAKEIDEDAAIAASEKEDDDVAEQLLRAIIARGGENAQAEAPSAPSEEQGDGRVPQDDRQQEGGEAPTEGSLEPQSEVESRLKGIAQKVGRIAEVFLATRQNKTGYGVNESSWKLAKAADVNGKSKKQRIANAARAMLALLQEAVDTKLSPSAEGAAFDAKRAVLKDRIEALNQALLLDDLNEMVKGISDAVNLRKKRPNGSTSLAADVDISELAAFEHVALDPFFVAQRKKFDDEQNAKRKEQDARIAAIRSGQTIDLLGGKSETAQAIKDREEERKRKEQNAPPVGMGPGNLFSGGDKQTDIEDTSKKITGSDLAKRILESQDDDKPSEQILEADSQVIEKVKKQNFVLKDVSVDDVLAKDSDAQAFLKAHDENEHEKWVVSDDPIVIGKWDGPNKVLDGYHRLAVAKLRGDSKIQAWVAVEDVTKTKEKPVVAPGMVRDLSGVSEEERHRLGKEEGVIWLHKETEEEPHRYTLPNGDGEPIVDIKLSQHESGAWEYDVTTTLPNLNEAETAWVTEQRTYRSDKFYNTREDALDDALYDLQNHLQEYESAINAPDEYPTLSHDEKAMVGRFDDWGFEWTPIKLYPAQMRVLNEWKYHEGGNILRARRHENWKNTERELAKSYSPRGEFTLIPAVARSNFRDNDKVRWTDKKEEHVGHVHPYQVKGADSKGKITVWATGIERANVDKSKLTNLSAQEEVPDINFMRELYSENRIGNSDGEIPLDAEGVEKLSSPNGHTVIYLTRLSSGEWTAASDTSGFFGGSRDEHPTHLDFGKKMTLDVHRRYPSRESALEDIQESASNKILHSILAVDLNREGQQNADDQINWINSLGTAFKSETLTEYYERSDREYEEEQAKKKEERKAKPKKTKEKPEDQKTPEPEKPKGFGSENTIFTEEEMLAALQELTGKPGQTNAFAPLDPRLLGVATKVAGFYIEGGIREFGAFAKVMIEKVGPNIKPFLKYLYLQVKGVLGSKFDDFTPDDVIDAHMREILGADYDRFVDKSTGQLKPMSQVMSEAVAGQVSYSPSSKAPGLKTLTPKNMATPIQNSLELLVNKVGNLDEFVSAKLGMEQDKINEVFSAEQVDAIALGIYQAENGSGFIIGDQTGIGKGRVVAGMLRYAHQRGMIPVFVTEKGNLYKDIFRDMTDIGMKMADGARAKILPTNSNLKDFPVTDDETGPRIQIGGGQQDKVLKEVKDLASLRDLGYEMIATTYSQMQSIGKVKPERIKALERIAPNAFFVFDESHNAGGVTATNEGVTEKDDETETILRSEVARDLASRAGGIMFSSATWAKRPEVMDLYFRTNMRFSIPQAARLAGAIRRGGLALQQVVSSMLAKDGQYIRRERDMSDIDYTPVEVPVEFKDANKVSDSIRTVMSFDQMLGDKDTWSDYSRAAYDWMLAEGKIPAWAMETKVNEDGSAKPPLRMGKRLPFTTRITNIVDQMFLNLKAQAMVDEVVKELDEGRKPIITVSNTMGSFLDNFAKENDTKVGDKIDANFGDMLLRYLNNTRKVTVVHVESKERFSAIPPLDILPDNLADNYRAAERIIKGIDWSNMPASPIDWIKSELKKKGHEFGEITGRGMYIDYTGESPVLRQRGSSETSYKGRNNTLKKYNDDKNTSGMIINQSAASGVSAHATGKSGDKRPRTMIVGQADKNIDVFMQLLGRIDRTGRISAPRYKQLIANVASDRRPAAILLRKLGELNANTNASRGSVFSEKVTVPDMMNLYGDHVALSILTDDVNLWEDLGRPLRRGKNGKVTGSDAMNTLTGRIPLLPVDEQLKVYERLEAAYEKLIAIINQSGLSSLEAAVEDLQAKPLQAMVLHPGRTDVDSVFGGSATAIEVEANKVIKPMKWEDVMERVNQWAGGETTEEPTKTDENMVSGNGVEARRVGVSFVAVKFSGNNFYDNLNEFKRKFGSVAKWNAVQKEWSVAGNSADDPIIAQVMEWAASKAEKNALGANSSSLKAATKKRVDKRIEQEHQRNPSLTSDENKARTLNDLRDTTNKLHVGAPVKFSMNDSHTYGVVVGYSFPAANESFLALSNWVIHVATAESSAPLHIPMSQVSVGVGGDKPVNIEALSDYKTDGLIQTDFKELFSDTEAIKREKRVVVVGNLLGGYDSIPGGKITYFTKADGGMSQGILLPRTWSFDEVASRAPVEVASAESLKTMVRSLISKWTDFDLYTPDGVSIYMESAGDKEAPTVLVSFQVSDPRGVAYYTDSGVQAALEGKKPRDEVSDWINAKQVFVLPATSATATVERVIEALKTLNARFYIQGYKTTGDAKKRAPHKVYNDIIDDAVGHDLDGRIARAKVGEDFKYSRDPQSTGMAVKTLREAVRAEFGKATNLLMARSRVKIVQSVEDIPPRPNGKAHPRDAVAATTPDGQVYIVADHASMPMVRSILLHELGVHVGMADMIGQEQFEQILKQLDRQKKEGDKAVLHAASRVPKDTAPENVREETLAYLVEMAPEHNIVKRLIAAIRQWLWKMTKGKLPITLTPLDLRVMASYSLRHAADRVDFKLRGMEMAYGAKTPWVYSKALKVTLGLPATKMSAENWIATLMNKGVKQEELNYLELKEWLYSLGRQASRDEVADYINANSLQIEEVVKGVNRSEEEAVGSKMESIRAKLRGFNFTMTRDMDGDWILDPTVPYAGQDSETQGDADPDDGIFDSPEKIAKYLKFLDDDHETREDEIANRFRGGKPLPKTDEERMVEAEKIFALAGEFEILAQSMAENDGQSQYESQWSTPGGKDYREFLLLLPKQFVLRGTGGDISEQITPHWSETNVVAHVRVSGRVTEDGKKMLLVDENQSDWHQTARKRRKERIRELALERGIKRKDSPEYKALAKEVGDDFGYITKKVVEERDAAFLRDGTESTHLGRWVADAPFKKTWHLLAFKRMVQYAVENGYEQIGWTTGDTQNERYGEEFKVETFDWNNYEVYWVHKSGPYKGFANNVGDDKEALVGRELVVYYDDPNTQGRGMDSVSLYINKDGVVDAVDRDGWSELEGRTIEEIFGKKVADGLAKEGFGSKKLSAKNSGKYNVSGQGVTFGGEGMRGFYDKKMVADVNSEFRKFDVKVGKTSFTYTDDEIKKVKVETHVIDITPKLKEAALHEGFPMYTRDQTKTSAFKRWFRKSKVVDKNGEPLVVYHGTDRDFTEFSQEAEPFTGAPSARMGFFFTDSTRTAQYYAQGGIDRLMTPMVKHRLDAANSRYEPNPARPGPGPNIIPVYLSIQNPLVVDMKGRIYREESYASVIARAKAAGHDGVIIKNTYDADERSFFDTLFRAGSTVYVAFRPEQIKSAIGNRGTFDPNNPDFRYTTLGTTNGGPTQNAGDRIANAVWYRQPIDRAFRLPFTMIGGLDEHGRWKPGVVVREGVRKVLNDKKIDPEGLFGFAAPYLEAARAGLIDRYQQPQAYITRDEERQVEREQVLRKAKDLLKSLSRHVTDPQEWAAIQAILTTKEEDRTGVTNELFETLSEPVRLAIDEMSKQAVELGLISQESYERHKGIYLHRVYLPHEQNMFGTGLGRWIGDHIRRRRKKIVGDYMHGRGIFSLVSEDILTRFMPGPQSAFEGMQSDVRPDINQGNKFRVLQLVTGDVTGHLFDTHRGRVRDTVYLPADQPVPAEFQNYTDVGVWEVRGRKGGEITLWRDYTVEERTAMGEILDARYTIAKTFMLMANDITTGKFYRDIATNADWVQTTRPNISNDEIIENPQQVEGRRRLFTKAKWVLVPESTIAGGRKRWGALAGKYVRAEIWRDLNELDVLSQPRWWDGIMTQWKLMKALALDTPLPTATGWTTMGEVKVGDTLFDEKGNPCSVLEVKDIQHGRPCYEVSFSDGTAITADEEHLWFTIMRNQGEGIRTTGQILETLYESSRGDRNHSIPVSDPLKLPAVDLFMPPYALGVWLGDGDMAGPRVTSGPADAGEMAVHLTNAGVELGKFCVDKRNGVITFNINNYRAKMRENGLLGNKHIPKKFLRASEEQRRELLMGLMDTDGHVTKKGTCLFSTSLPKLRDDVLELLRSLGYKPSVREYVPKCDGKAGKSSFCIHYQAYSDRPVFRLGRKVIRLRQRPVTKQRSQTRQIVAITKVPSVPVRCIAVSSESNLYLAGRGMVPTHNTARNPVVHMNNVVSNIFLMDFADVTAIDLKNALIHMKNEDDEYQDAMNHMALGNSWMSAELRRDVLQPIIEELSRNDLTNNAEATQNILFKIRNIILKKIGDADDVSQRAYQWEDEIFRMATYTAQRRLGYTPSESAQIARDQFINYDIRAPWVNAARSTILPFVGYSYRAIPLLVQSMMYRPWKLAKYFTLSYGLTALSLALVPGDEDEERKALREDQRGFLPIGVPRMQRLPFTDMYGNVRYLDLRRWMPAGDVIEVNEKMAIPMWQPLNIGGPFMVAAEIVFNKQMYSQSKIVEPGSLTPAADVTKYLYQQIMPSAVVIPGTHYYERVKEAARGVTAKDGAPPDPYSEFFASLGVKARGVDIAVGRKNIEKSYDRIEKNLELEEWRLRNDYKRGSMDREDYLEDKKKIQEAKKKNREKKKEALPKRPMKELKDEKDNITIGFNAAQMPDTASLFASLSVNPSVELLKALEDSDELS